MFNSSSAALVSSLTGPLFYSFDTNDSKTPPPTVPVLLYVYLLPVKHVLTSHCVAMDASAIPI
jgi:hypothetical protein